MFTFNEERLAYLLSKLQFEIDKKVSKDGDKQLSAEVFTQEEKAILAEILAAGSIDELIDARLDGMTLDIISSTDYEALKAADSFETDKLYIVSDEPIKAINLDGFATKEEVEELEELKQDKETYIGRVDSGGLEVVADGAVTDSNTQIAISDSRIFGEGFEIGEIIKDLTEQFKSYQQPYDKSLEELKEIEEVFNNYKVDKKSNK